MHESQQKAWNHLTELEQMALTLVVINERSKKEAAIIMNVAPYKFTEIYLRARKFFVMFTNHYAVFEDLIPEKVSVQKDFKVYMDQLIGYRKKPSEVVKQERMIELRKVSERNTHWTMLGISLFQEQYGSVWGIIQEFDRWNNFRILPKEHQFPAAFPRRRNKTLKKLQQGLYAISDHGWDLLMQKYGASDIPPLIFLPVIQSYVFRAYPIRETVGITDYMSRNKIPVFQREKDALDFAELCYDYRLLKKRSTYSARKFWANYRLLIKEAWNYAEVTGIRLAEEAIISQNDQKFLKSVQKPKRVIRGRTAETEFYPD